MTARRRDPHGRPAAAGVVPVRLAALLVALAAALSGACSPGLPKMQEPGPTAAAMTTVEGLASPPAPQPLPRGAVFEATLEDVSRAGAPAQVVGRVTARNPQWPVRFVIPFEASDIRPGGLYAVRARVLVDGQLWFTSDRLHRVLTDDAGGAGGPVEISMRSVARAGQPPPGGDRDPAGALPAHGLRLPASFRGDLPCADCQGVRHQLDLWPDQVFHLRREWLGKGLVRGDIGRWRLDAGRRALVLQGGTEMPLQFQVLGAERLRQLGLAGQPIVSPLPYELRSEGTLDPADVSLLMQGEFTAQADGARFVECLTGRSHAVAPGPGATQLQRAYLAANRPPGAALHVSFEGTITRRPAPEGDRLVSTVVVDRFVGTWPGQACPRAEATASLFNTYWRIERLMGESVPALPGRREPHLVLRHTDAGRSYAATTGCNQLVGSVESTDGRIAFSRVATTLMACPAPLAGSERQLGEVLARSRQWQVRGSTLVLTGEAGDELATLEAAYFR